ncbi:hypothetical protein CEP48_00850 [Mergibacter septicus]|uniref:BstA-like C-terminal domain-containing protein n=1 Tax=Mergibacter septicus TaxID=221402 RepID=A0A8D4IWR3_9PAST|nr:hypothetical protein [Mergibacter septicus]AWX14814.1 hypothetical protein CEP47_00850 [Mergibacter septicus]QDJ14066.1 hypothetical protein CEP48_00850 [Mergibacter septicus]UTU48486.1 hypothetical protein HLL31_06785 [Mergibacter septicus]WMR95885.1 hypothetical protein RDJ12_08215 [Mergibacter septicus]
MNKNYLIAPSQGVLDISIEKEIEVNGIGMGVLGNGVPYLTQTGLANACGISRITLQALSTEWEESAQKGVYSTERTIFLSNYLSAQGFNETKLFIQVIKNGSIHYAYPDVVCMAIIEFYAFESKRIDNTIALQSFRELAKFGLKEYIYKTTGYIPDDPWKHYHNRVSILKNMGSVPEGYFIIFNEIAGMIVDLINAGLLINQHTVPDISVGIAWSKYWKDNNLESKFGKSVFCSHYYPEDFSQFKSNPQQINAYPENSLSEFRQWFRNCYLKTKFPKYILKKTLYLPKGKETATQLIETFN